MGPTSQGTPTPMMSPAPPGGPQDSMGYNLNMNGNDYASPMSGSQVHTIFQERKTFVNHMVENCRVAMKYIVLSSLFLLFIMSVVEKRFCIVFD